MASRYYRATSATGFNSTSSWSATQYGSTGASVPVTGDSAFFLDGSQDLDAYDASGVILVNMVVGPNYSGKIGSASAPLKIGISGTLTYSGTGQWCKIAASTDNIATVHVERTQGTFYLTSGAFTTLWTGTPATIVIEAAATITTILSAGAVLTIADNATDITTAEFVGPSVVSSYRDIDTVIVGPQASYTTFEDVTVDTSIDVYGIFNHNSTGTIASATGRPGSTSSAPNARYAGFTITASKKYQNARFFENDTGITFTAEPTLIGHTAR